jgi:Resolvase, N terminal domain
VADRQPIRNVALLVQPWKIHNPHGEARSVTRRSNGVRVGESIDTTTAAGRLQLHILGAFAEFERGRITERVHARARQHGKRLGARRSTPLPTEAPKGLTVRSRGELPPAAGVGGMKTAKAKRAGRPPAGIDGKPSSEYPQLAGDRPASTV